MTRRAGMRGQPLLLFGAVLTGWLAFRIALWESPFTPRFEPPAPKARPATMTAMAVRPIPKPESGAAHSRPGRGAAAFVFDLLPERPRLLAAPFAPYTSSLPVPPPPLPLLAMGPASRAPLAKQAETLGDDRLLVEDLAPRQAPAAGLTQRHVSAVRWSGDGWLLVRRDSAPGVPGPALSDRPGYGRSQVGAVVRYALAFGDPVRAQVHVRAAAALSGPREREVAAGLSLRPLPGVPLRAVAEARLGETGIGAGRGTSLRLRPAVYAVTEFPPLTLPLGSRAEAYLQGGYVGGDFATPFVDGQARVERSLARAGKGELSVGVGVWGGAQRASSRLDVGPTAAVAFQLGAMRGRLAADYRFRLAGKARPASGPALTLSAGF